MAMRRGESRGAAGTPAQSSRARTQGPRKGLSSPLATAKLATSASATAGRLRSRPLPPARRRRRRSFGMSGSYWRWVPRRPPPGSGADPATRSKGRTRVSAQRERGGVVASRVPAAREDEHDVDGGVPRRHFLAFRLRAEDLPDLAAVGRAATLDACHQLCLGRAPSPELVLQLQAGENLLARADELARDRMQLGSRRPPLHSGSRRNRRRSRRRRRRRRRRALAPALGHAQVHGVAALAHAAAGGQAAVRVGVGGLALHPQPAARGVGEAGEGARAQGSAQARQRAGGLAARLLALWYWARRLGASAPALARRRALRRGEG
eukprot:scaffold119303_cov51-Phaeocystis_antarctica.AAC.2